MPSTVRYYTFVPHEKCQTLGTLQNEILPRVQNGALKMSEVKDDSDASAWQAAVNKKIQAILHVNEDLNTHRNLLTHALLAVPPIEDLSLTLQTTDHHGGSLKHLIQKSESGCVDSCMRKYWEIANFWIESPSSKLLPAMQWFCASDNDNEYRKDSFDDCVALAAAVWVRRHKYLFLPWSLLSLPLLAEEIRLVFVRVFLDLASTPDCCADETVALPLRTAFVLQVSHVFFCLARRMSSFSSQACCLHLLISCVYVCVYILYIYIYR